MATPARIASVAPTHFESVRGQFSYIGVRQFGDPVLRKRCKPIALPNESSLANEILACLLDTIQRARKLHTFSKGVGLAAPQIGMLRRIAVVHPLEELPIRMINPRVIELSRDTDIKFEGCLSFFDYRGEVRRAVSTTIEFCDTSGRSHRRSLEGDAARLALHEIDHLDGTLYIDRMTKQGRLIEADEQHP
jgi:peptide deformylase